MRIRSLALIPLALVGSSGCVLFGGPAGGGSSNAITLGDEVLEADLSVEVQDEITMASVGLGQCSGNANTTAAPAFTFRVGEATSDLVVDLDSVGALSLPDGRYTCISGNPVAADNWPAGTYRVFVYSSTTRRAGGHLRVYAPQRVADRVQRDARVAPRIEFDATQNPKSIERANASPQPAAGTLEPCLEGYGDDRLFIRARLEVAADGRYDIPGIVVDETGSCAPRASHGGRNSFRKPYQLKAGARYVVWSKDDGDLFVEGIDQSLAYPDSESFDLKDHVAFPASVPPESRDKDNCQDTGHPPSARIALDTPTAISVAPLKTTTALADVYGPIGPDAKWNCGVTPKRALMLEKGDYYVWGYGEAGASVVVSHGKADRDPLFTAGPAIADAGSPYWRRLDAHYPFASDRDYRRLFLELPESMFVYATESVSRTKYSSTSSAGYTPPQLQVAAGEPLVEIRDNRYLRADGTVVTDLQTAPESAAITLPKTFYRNEIKNVDWAIAEATEADKAMVDKYETKLGEFRSCVSKYMKKNAPGWGTGKEFVYVDNGESVTQAYFRKADRKCGRKPLAKVENKLMGQVKRSQAKNIEVYRAQVGKRFGLEP